MKTQLVMILGVVIIIAVAHIFIGSYNEWMDLTVVFISISLTTVLIKLNRWKVTKLSARQSIVSAFTCLLILWILLSATDFAFERVSIPLMRPIGLPNEKVSKKIALTLSGGGYRAALFHAGVLEELEKIGAKPSVLSTVSGGSIVGAFYGSGGLPRDFVDAFIKGRFNLKRRMLRIDNTLKLFGSLLGSIKLPYISMNPLSFLDMSYTVTTIQAQMLDDLFLNGTLVKDTQEKSDIAQMVCLTDILNSELIGITSKGTVVRSIDTALARTNFRNPSRKGENIARFLTSDLIKLPALHRMSTLVAASGAFPGVFDPYTTNRWTLAESFNGKAVLADGGLADNHGIVLLNVVQQLAQNPPNPENNPGEEWDVRVAIVSDGSAISGKFEPSGYLSTLSRSLDVIYNMTGGSYMYDDHSIETRRTSYTNENKNLQLFLLSPRTIAKQESSLTHGVSPSSMWGNEKQNEYPVSVFGSNLVIQIEGSVPIRFADISYESMLGLAAIMMPRSTGYRLNELAKKLYSEDLITSFGMLTESGEVPVDITKLNEEQMEVMKLVLSEIDLSLQAFLSASTLSDRFDADQAEAIYRLGKIVVRLNTPFIN